MCIGQLIGGIKHFEDAPGRGPARCTMSFTRARVWIGPKRRHQYARKATSLPGVNPLAAMAPSALKHEVAADADHEDVAEEADDAGQGEEEVARVDRADLLVIVGVGGLLEPFRLLLLTSEDLDHDHAGEILLQPGGDVAKAFAGRRRRWA